MNKPLVSVGLPVYNGETYLRESIESILNQTYSHLELVISDNGSTDSTREICQEYAQRDQRITLLLNDQNRGAAWNYNRVFAHAGGKYFRWTAADDLCDAHHLEACVDILEKQPDVVLAYPRSSIIDETGALIRQHDDNMHLMHTSASARIAQFDPGLCHPVFGLIRSADLAETALIGNYVSSDIPLLWQLLLIGKFYEVPERYFMRRSHENSSVRANPDFKSRLQWFDPNHKAKFQLPRWRRQIEFVRAIVGADLPTAEKMRCYRVVFERYILHPGWMLKDWNVALQELVGLNPMSNRNLH